MRVDRVARWHVLVPARAGYRKCVGWKKSLAEGPEPGRESAGRRRRGRVAGASGSAGTDGGRRCAYRQAVGGRRNNRSSGVRQGEFWPPPPAGPNAGTFVPLVPQSNPAAERQIVNLTREDQFSLRPRSNRLRYRSRGCRSSGRSPQHRGRSAAPSRHLRTGRARGSRRLPYARGSALRDSRSFPT